MYRRFKFSSIIWHIAKTLEVIVWNHCYLKCPNYQQLTTWTFLFRKTHFESKIMSLYNKRSLMKMFLCMYQFWSLICEAFAFFSSAILYPFYKRVSGQITWLLPIYSSAKSSRSTSSLLTDQASLTRGEYLSSAISIDTSCSTMDVWPWL